MEVHIKNPYGDTKTEFIAQKMVGNRMFIGWPFLQEDLVVAIVQIREDECYIW